MGEIKEFGKVNTFVIQSRMEHILTLLEEGIEEAHANGEKMKAESCLGAIYKELVKQYEELLDNPYLYRVFDKLIGLLDHDEEYVKKHISMTEEEIHQEYIEYLDKMIEDYPKAGVVRFKVQDKLQKDEYESKDDLVSYVEELTNNELMHSACVRLVETEVNKLLLSDFINSFGDLMKEVTNDENYDEGD